MNLVQSFYMTILCHINWDTILKRQIEKSTHITLVFGCLQRVQHLGVVINTESSNHLPFAQHTNFAQKGTYNFTCLSSSEEARKGRRTPMPQWLSLTLSPLPLKTKRLFVYHSLFPLCWPPFFFILRWTWLTKCGCPAVWAHCSASSWLRWGLVDN